MRIDVTVEDIFIGRRRSCSACPVALALKRARPELHFIVHSYGVTVFKGDKLFKRLDLPRAARSFILEFDEGYSVKPFSFELEGFKFAY